jgi:hypothetical protein
LFLFRTSYLSAGFVCRNSVRDLNEKIVKAYNDALSVTELREFPNDSHCICREPGWEEVATFIEGWSTQNQWGAAGESRACRRVA